MGGGNFSSPYFFDMKTLDTGFKLRDIVGGMYYGYGSGEKMEHYIYAPDLTQKERCNLCQHGPRENCTEWNTDDYCIKGKYYVVRGLSNKEINDRSVYGVVNVNDLAKTCRDFCIFYGKNCYNERKDHCVLRFLMNDIKFNR